MAILFVILLRNVGSKQEATLFSTLSLGFYSCLLVFFCWFADRVGRKKILFIGAVNFILFSYFLFVVLSLHTSSALISGLLILAVLSGSIMIYPSILVELFPVSIRYTGIAISYNLAFAFFGGLTPLIATYLIEYSHNVLAPSFYLMMSALFCAIAVLTIKKLYGNAEIEN